MTFFGEGKYVAFYVLRWCFMTQLILSSWDLGFYSAATLDEENQPVETVKTGKIYGVSYQLVKEFAEVVNGFFAYRIAMILPKGKPHLGVFLVLNQGQTLETNI